jgi:hypothetical protein
VQFAGVIPSTYAVQNDCDEASSAIVTVATYSRTADGEVPQLQGVFESQGGGDQGSMVVNPGIEVSTVTTISGAAVAGGVTGTDAI